MALMFFIYKKHYSQTVRGLTDQAHVHISRADGRLRPNVLQNVPIINPRRACAGGLR